MAITSVDSYLLEEIELRLKSVLSNCYIINEILKDYNQSTRDNFIEAFCGENAQNEITVGFKSPDFKNNTKAHYLIYLGEGLEVDNSVGNIQGDFIGQGGNTLREQSVFYKDGDKLKLKVQKPIKDILDIDDISFAEISNLTFEDDTISIDYDWNEDLEGYNATVTYEEKLSDKKGLVKGFTVQEQVTVVGLSNNVDTARCMDAVLKTILISMRDNLQEQQSFQLQRLTFGDLSPMITETDFAIYGRPTVISYTTSVDMDYTITKEINEIVYKERMKYASKKTTD